MIKSVIGERDHKNGFDLVIEQDPKQLDPCIRLERRQSDIVKNEEGYSLFRCQEDWRGGSRQYSCVEH